jgi:hypothetical protein
MGEKRRRARNRLAIPGPSCWRGVRDLNPWTRSALTPRRHTPFEESRVNPGTSSPRGSPRQSRLSTGVPYSLGDILETGPESVAHATLG